MLSKQQFGHQLDSNQIALKSAPEFVIYTARSFIKNECSQAAAALTYATLFALVPLLAVSYKIFSMFPFIPEAPSLISDFIMSHMMPESGNRVLRQVEEFSSQADNLTALGIFVLIFTALMMIRKIEKTFNKIWEVEESRKGIKTVMLYWLVLSVGAMVIGVGLAVSSYIASLKIFEESINLTSFQPQLLGVLPFISSIIALSLMYAAVPNCYVPAMPAIAGAIVASALFELAKKSFAIFASTFSSFEVIYGAFAAIPLFILWVYISWTIVLLGVEVVKALVVFKPKDFERDRPPLISLLQIIQYCWEKQQHGQLVTKEDMRAFLNTLPDADWGELRNILIHNNILQRTDSGDFAVVADLHLLSLKDLVYMTPWGLAEFRELKGFKDEQEWEKHLVDKWQTIDRSISDEFDVPLNRLLGFDKKESAN